MSQLNEQERWVDTNTILSRGGPFTSGSFNENDEESRNFIRNVKVLVIGAGGLGCELLKDLALVGFRDIEVIDMDTVDYSNLNRQFLFRPSDVTHSKAERAAAFINKRVPGVNVKAHHAKIQDMSDDFYMNFHVIISGLDSISARRWMNEKIYSLASKKMADGRELEEWDDDTRIPFIDGGTEGFLGNARFIYPHKTPCFDCVDLFPAQQHVYQMCTIVNTPRQPEHCVAWAKDHAWTTEFPFGKNDHGDAAHVDGDNPEHIQWILQKALEHADRFNIPKDKITYKLTQGVVKNIIPAIAATNAIIAATCANEAFKAVTEASRNLDNYIYYWGNQGVGSNTQKILKKEDCNICTMKGFNVKIKKDLTLTQFLEFLKKDERLKGMTMPALLRCDINNKKHYLCFLSQPRYQKKYDELLPKPMAELVEEGDIVLVTSTTLKHPVTLKIYWEK
jgi:ubiquitin-activating enzyme E1 C